MFSMPSYISSSWHLGVERIEDSSKKQDKDTGFT